MIEEPELRPRRRRRRPGVRTRHADDFHNGLTSGFVPRAYAHVLKNDNRDAAEQAASFPIGDLYYASIDAD